MSFDKRLFRDEGNGRVYLIDTTYMKHLTEAELGALTAIGFTYTSHLASFIRALASAHGIPAASIPTNNGTYTIAQSVPVTVQGASESFITNAFGQVNANTNLATNQVNAFNATYRDQVKAHVTAESDRVIAAV